MRLENADFSRRSLEIAPPSTAAGPTPVAVGVSLGPSIHDDVERLIQIAGQLYSAIERQIHSIEVNLMFVQSEISTLSSATVFKEQLIRSATDLDSSMKEIALHLGERVAAQEEHSFHPRSTFVD
jgi:hypothetical protein